MLNTRAQVSSEQRRGQRRGRAGLAQDVERGTDPHSGPGKNLPERQEFHRGGHGGPSIPNSYIARLFVFFLNNVLQAKSGFEMCFDIGSQHIGCWSQNTSRIQNKKCTPHTVFAGGELASVKVRNEVARTAPSVPYITPSMTISSKKGYHGGRLALWRWKRSRKPGPACTHTWPGLHAHLARPARTPGPACTHTW